MSWLPGQECGNGVADVIFGTVNPSGRLPVTIPTKDNEVGFTPEQYPGVGTPREAVYSEGLLIGYRWYDYNGVTPTYPFGYGLSYTTFSYANVRVSQRSSGRVYVYADITNTGSRAGDEVAQLYVTYPSAAAEPVNQLRDFDKVNLQPNETKTVSFELEMKDFSIWNTNIHNWEVIYNQDYGLHIGSSSRDFYLEGKIQFNN